MTITAALGRISQIESTFTALAPANHAPAPSGQATVRPGESFAAALARVTTPGLSADATAPRTATDLAGGPALLNTIAGLGPATAAAATATAPTSDTSQGEQIVTSAKAYLGTPYVWGGESLAEGGLDCSGLVHLVFSEHGIDLPRVARQQMHEGTEVPSLQQAQPGDLIVTRGGAHIGIYVGDGDMIHAPRPGRTVEIRPLREGEITTIRRIV